MAKTLEQVKADIPQFIERWTRRESWEEKQHAGTFMAQFLELFTGISDPLELDEAADFEWPMEAQDEDGGNLYPDFFWPGKLIIEMKGTKESHKLAEHRPQLKRYWENSSVNGIPAPEHVILCSFDRFEIWEMGRYPMAPRDSFELKNLGEHVESFLFLIKEGATPIYGGLGQAITIETSRTMVDLYHHLYKRHVVEANTGLTDEQLRRFMIQCTWLMFAEDMDIIHSHAFTTKIDQIIKLEKSGLAADPAGKTLQNFLLALDNESDFERNAIAEGLPRVNGALFRSVPYIPLDVEDLQMIRSAATFDWREVNPTIFGSLFEGSMGENRRKFGAHYTHEQDIMQIIEPTILKPWRDKIDQAKTIKQLESILKELCSFKVLDPACGSANFLYVAYREMRTLEKYLKDKIEDAYTVVGKPHRMSIEFYPIENLYGIELDPFAVEIARLTLWMGHGQMSKKFNELPNDKPLPLHSLKNIVQGDALKIDWPEVNAIIGNPPFIGSQHIRDYNGDEYIDFLHETYKCGIKDLCTYWFRKANDHMGKDMRAGFVASNSVTQNKNRAASLEYIVAHKGVITEATSSQPWPGEANVHVSIVSWVKDPTKEPKNFLLDQEPVSGITPSLRENKDHGIALKIAENKGISFQGALPGRNGFLIDNVTAQKLLSDKTVNYADVVKRHLGSDDIANEVDQIPSGWIIDFNEMPLEDSMQYPKALQIVKEKVQPYRLDKNNKPQSNWWRHHRPRRKMRNAIEPLSKYIAVGRHSKRPMFVWGDKNWYPSDATVVVASDSAWMLGVLSSSIHLSWILEHRSTLETRIRYTPTTIFETFPFPEKETNELQNIEETMNEIVRLRSKASHKLNDIGASKVGLTGVYNSMDEGAFTDLAQAHRRLDQAVCRSYGWDTAILNNHDEILAQIYELNSKKGV